MSAFLPVILILAFVLIIILAPFLLTCGVIALFGVAIALVINLVFPGTFNFFSNDNVEKATDKQYTVDVNKKSASKVKPVVSKPIANTFHSTKSFSAIIDSALTISENDNFSSIEIIRIYFDGNKNTLSKYDTQELSSFAKAFKGVKKIKLVSIIAYRNPNDTSDMLKKRKLVFNQLSHSGVSTSYILNDGSSTVEKSREAKSFVQINVQAGR